MTAVVHDTSAPTCERKACAASDLYVRYGWPRESKDVLVCCRGCRIVLCAFCFAFHRLCFIAVDPCSECRVDNPERLDAAHRPHRPGCFERRMAKRGLFRCARRRGLHKPGPECVGAAHVVPELG